MQLEDSVGNRNVPFSGTHLTSFEFQKDETRNCRGVKSFAINVIEVGKQFLIRNHSINRKYIRFKSTMSWPEAVIADAEEKID